MNKREPDPHDAASWKRKIGAELSGLEGPRDWLVLLAIVAVFLIVAIVIAFVAFG